MGAFEKMKLASFFVATSSVTSAERWTKCEPITPTEGSNLVDSNGLICAGALCERDCLSGWGPSPTTKVSCRKLEDGTFEWSTPLGPCVTCGEITPLKESIGNPPGTPKCKINKAKKMICALNCGPGYHSFGGNEGKLEPSLFANVIKVENV